MKIQDYYKNPNVRTRIVEYLGGNSLKAATCIYLTRCDEPLSFHDEPKPVSALDFYLKNGMDVARSLWDREALVVHLDIEYVNFDFPAEPYLDPVRMFSLQQPVVRAVKKILADDEITPLHLLSGRGHHFVWRVQRESPAFQKLAKIGRVPQHLRKLYAGPHPPLNLPVEPELGAAFAGLGLVIEYLSNLVKAEASSHCKIPVQLSDVAVGPGQRGREMISIDVTEYGDPLHTRLIRIPFSAYLKPWKKHGILQPQIRDRVPLMYLIPFLDTNIEAGMRVMRSASEAAELAGRVSVQIPDQSEAMEHLIERYSSSPLAKFHDWFYAQEHEPPHLWPQTYDRTPLEPLPPCVRHILLHPNDLLLQPAGIRQVVRAMLALGWHPRHIAGLIRSKYERDYGWGREWYHYDAATRADFYTRVFTGLVVTNRDELIDFNCLSTKEKKFCFHPDYWCNLEEFKKSLVERIDHERLASRPFNRLFLSNQHL